MAQICCPTTCSNTTLTVISNLALPMAPSAMRLTMVSVVSTCIWARGAMEILIWGATTAA